MTSTTPPTSTPPPSAAGPSGAHRKIPWEKIGVFAAVAVIGGLVGGFVGYYLHTSSGTASAASAGSSSCSIPSIADKVLPSVVTISARKGAAGGTGSGSIIRSDGYILTNNHVVATAVNGGMVEIAFADGQTSRALITGRDSLTDLAVLKVDEPEGLRPIALGSSGSVRVGDQVMAIGSPLGLSGTVTSGIVSALDRTIQVPGENDRAALLVSALQTDAAINPGNSGGALVDCSGDLVGVPTAGATVPSAGQTTSGSIGLGFAIPVDLATAIADEIIATGRVTHSFFGLQTAPVPSSVASEARVPPGLYVQAVTAGGPSARAGLRSGDIITAIDGKPATSNIQLQELTVTKKPGESVSIEYWRDGRSDQTNVVLAPQP
jgi:putative serine protease PepD